MPLYEPIKERGDHNRSFLATLDLETTPFLDWAVVIAFYVAVRYVDAYFHPVRPVDHPERLTRVQRDQRTRPIYRQYRELYNQSRSARYELVTFERSQVKALLANELSKVVTHMSAQ
jgi:hypothetical protein